ncbi:transposase [Piscirickettsia salmonis]|nr:transposase [Piscirickettsia salmonis]
MFYAWLVKDLLPKLPAHSVIVMDNARFHKRCEPWSAKHGVSRPR